MNTVLITAEVSVTSNPHAGAGDRLFLCPGFHTKFKHVCILEMVGLPFCIAGRVLEVPLYHICCVIFKFKFNGFMSITSCSIIIVNLSQPLLGPIGVLHKLVYHSWGFCVQICSTTAA